MKKRKRLIYNFIRTPTLDKKALAVKPENMGHDAARWVIGKFGVDNYSFKNGVFYIKGERLNGFGEFIKKVNEYRVADNLPQYTKNPAWLHPEPERPKEKKAEVIRDKNGNVRRLTDGANQRIYKSIFALGMNVREFCDAYGIHHSQFSKLANGGLSPCNLDGHWREITLRVSHALKMPPEELFEKSSCAEE
jgi:hypothetical protein